jgi:hypothetical protein
MHHVPFLELVSDFLGCDVHEAASRIVIGVFQDTVVVKPAAGEVLDDEGCLTAVEIQRSLELLMLITVLSSAALIMLRFAAAAVAEARAATSAPPARRATTAFQTFVLGSFSRC